MVTVCQNSSVTSEEDTGSALEDVADALAILTAYRHDVGSELVSQLLDEAKEKSTWYEGSNPPESGSADDELSRGLRDLQQSFAQIVAQFERVTHLLDGMRNLASILLDNWAKAVDAEPEDVLEAVGQKLAQTEN